MEELFSDINWLAVIIGAVAAWALGGLWYSPKMFGQKWMEAVGLSKDKIKTPAPAMITQAVGTFLLAWLVGITETTDSIYTAVLIALTISVLIKANGLFAQKKMVAIKIESGFVLAMVIVMIAAHALF